MADETYESGSDEYRERCREIGLERILNDADFRAEFPKLDAGWNWARDNLSRIAEESSFERQGGVVAQKIDSARRMLREARRRMQTDPAMAIAYADSAERKLAEALELARK